MPQGVRSPIFRNLLTGARFVVTAGLLTILLVKVDIVRLEQVMARGSPEFFLAAALALAATMPFNAARWHVILGDSPGIGWATLLKILWMGLFFNQVLPSGVGGDAVRAWRCSKLGMGLGNAIRSILLDRACGYALLVLIYAAGMPKLLQVIQDPLPRRTLVVVLAGAIGGLIALFFIDWLPRRVVVLRVIQPLATLSRDARRTLLDRHRSIRLIGLTGVTITLSVLSFEWVGRSVGIDIPFLDWLIIVPPVTLIQLVPVSLAGWGVREVAIVVILGGFGVSAETALAASLAAGICQIVVGLPGGLVWIGNWDLSGHQSPPVAAQATASGAASAFLREPKPGVPRP